ncbi:MAG TPA: protein kinase [Terracidiphilus sp.]|nr:protein kinase [Terracidiphilus sp.]
MALSPKTRIDNYEILAPLGAGGMGEVYRARDLRLNREVAIKVLPISLAGDPERLRRFELEARAAAALNHPNILSVYQMGTFDGAPYIVSELLDGESLRERLRHGPLSLRKVVSLGAQTARGLAAAHEKGVIHRDLKPENLFLTRDGQAKVLDFGLARITQSSAPLPADENLQTQQTIPGVVLGTVGYMAPEQVRGQVADARSDIFAFAAILYEMITGRRAFKAPTSPETMTAILHDEPPPITELAPGTPVALQRVVQRGLEKDPEQRFQSASDMAFALEALPDASVLVAAPQLRSRSRRIPRPAIAALAVLVAILVLTWGYFQWWKIPVVPVVGNYVQLTHDGLQKTLLGADGVQLYMTLINSGAEGVAVMPADGGQATDLAMPSPNMIPLDVTEDGSKLLLVDGKGVPPVGSLWSLPVMGGSARRLNDVVGDTAAWSPDGNTLAFANGGDLYLADAEGSNPRKLFTVKRLIADLSWSPDGRNLSFDLANFADIGNAGAGLGSQALWEIASDGSDPHPMLGNWQGGNGACCGRWTADGKYFVFQSQGQIWALPTGHALFEGEPKPVQLTSSPMSLHSPMPSANGQKLYVVGRTYRGELSRYDAARHTFVPYLDGISAEWLDFSKDRKWIAYVSYPDGALWKCRADGSGKMQLTFPPAHPVLPRWSPDGLSLLYFEFPLGSALPGHIFEISADGGTPRELLPAGRNNQQDPNWSPDSTRIVFAGDANDASAGNAGPEIRILDLRTHVVTSVPGSQGLYSPRWSPDGHYLAAMTGDSERLMLYDFQTQRWTRIAKGSFGWLNWSHDSRFVYMKDFAGKGSVVRVEIRTRKLERVVDLTGFSDTGQGGGSLALTPDDAPLLLRDTGTQDVYAMDWKER